MKRIKIERFGSSFRPSGRWHVVVWMSLFLGLGACKAPAPPAGNGPVLDLQKLPLTDLEGKSETLARYQGNVILVNFWASWCGPCREEMPDLDRLYRDYHDRGLVVLGVSIDFQREDAVTFLREVQVQYPMYWEGADGPLAKALGGVTMLPTTILIDRQGRQVEKIIGPRTRSQFEERIKPLLAGDTG